MKVVIGADHGGFQLKEQLKDFIEKELGHTVADVGCDCPDSVDYPDYANEACNQVISGEADRGILVCGTGIGMSIAANKMPGIRCALAHDTFSARATREHNDTNVLALGERVVGPGLAMEIVKIWLETDFSQGERHHQRIQKIKQIEDSHAIHP
ncbi:ribose 5-phosphate isomerase B [Marinicrinis lubricantis]|uniref:Ribose 5-phosphate isomerase B n=1 Tax=Marinicrinis lubricantis TaxID=2086470 RepID=A0ABW1IK98_9BACL